MSNRQQVGRPSTLPDLDECAREPIHIPGSIQPPGVLLAVDALDGVVSQCSENAAALFERPLDDVLGTRWNELLELGGDWEDEERPWHTGWLSVGLPTRTITQAQPWRASLHLYERHWLIELEPLTDRLDLMEDPIRQGYELGRRLAQDRDVEAATRRTARLIRNELGYDRVMVYRFDRDWNGEVVAEAVRDDLEPYLGLHYPHTDIPAQARALYLRNRVRAIGDVNYVPCPIVPTLDPRHDRPLDMSDIALRSVSPVHVEYLSNMGVSATLVASIIVNSRLWGLIACHHYAALPADHSVRELADVVASALAARLGALEEIAEAELESDLLTVREKLITAFSENEQVTPDLLANLAPLLLEVVDADGVAVFSGDEVRAYGQLPDVATLREIRRGIGEFDSAHDMVTGVLHTDALGMRFPPLAPHAARAAGIIFMPLAQNAHNALLWTRREQVNDVRWGGNPYLSKLQTIPGARLSPRQSFDAWQETVRGCSRPWSEAHLESARGLRVLIELMERKHDQRNLSLMRASLGAMQQAVLIAEASGGRWQDARISFCNESLARAVGMTEQAVEGLPVSALLHEHGGAETLVAVDEALQRQRPAEVLLGLRRADGSRWGCRLRIEPVRDTQDQVSHWLATQLES